MFHGSEMGLSVSWKSYPQRRKNSLGGTLEERRDKNNKIKEKKPKAQQGSVNLGSYAHRE